ncbi:DUF2937 family protein [Aureimonas leprariae]|uniref:DUF2937 family protein n=1 Tax=Plantimonas leprariae TaxID=2615207 RepID=A0A7V7PTG4_9HYPH|nr:DUF2937 family protein [Aureimonas leprariae]KAB0682829.1 DUF2937 family protein [Aureimonas leprariae]
MRLLSRILFAALGAFLFGQSAEWTQQYLQRLGGAADELRAVVGRFDEGAAASGLSREAAVARLKSQSDALAARQGRDAEATAARYAEVERRYRDLSAAAPLLRPFVALGDMDGGIAARAMDDFRPALPVTPDGLALTGLGFVAGWGTGSSLAGAARMARRRRGVAT